MKINQVIVVNFHRFRGQNQRSHIVINIHVSVLLLMIVNEIEYNMHLERKTVLEISHLVFLLKLPTVQFIKRNIERMLYYLL